MVVPPRPWNLLAWHGVSQLSVAVTTQRLTGSSLKRHGDAKCQDMESKLKCLSWKSGFTVCRTTSATDASIATWEKSGGQKKENNTQLQSSQVCSKANFKIRGWTEPNTVSFTMRGHHLPLHVCMQRSINITLTKICVNSTGGLSPSFEPTVLKYPAEKPPVNAPWNLLYRPFSSLTVWSWSGTGFFSGSSVKTRKFLNGKHWNGKTFKIVVNSVQNRGCSKL